jgi:hypothetical protein
MDTREQQIRQHTRPNGMTTSKESRAIAGIRRLFDLLSPEIKRDLLAELIRQL